MVNTQGINPSTPNYSLDQILQATQPPKQPGAFRRILGSVVGGVGNMFAPGIGGLIGGAISGGILGGGIGGSLTVWAGGLGSDPAQFLALQQQMNQQQELFETASAIAKSRHDASMAAIRNIQ